jgi:hypothetical protein
MPFQRRGRGTAYHLAVDIKSAIVALAIAVNQPSLASYSRTTLVKVALSLCGFSTFTSTHRERFFLKDGPIVKSARAAVLTNAMAAVRA